jgi:hypothetical protein
VSDLNRIGCPICVGIRIPPHSLPIRARFVSIRVTLDIGLFNHQLIKPSTLLPLRAIREIRGPLCFAFSCASLRPFISACSAYSAVLPLLRFPLFPPVQSLRCLRCLMLMNLAPTCSTRPNSRSAQRGSGKGLEFPNPLKSPICSGLRTKTADGFGKLLVVR